MEAIIYFLAFSVVTMFFILKFDKLQSKRLNKILRETKNVQPLFLMRSAEDKLRTLNIKLYGNMVMGAGGASAGRVNMNAGAKRLVATQLTSVVNDYNNGQILLQDYNRKLTEILTMVNEVKEMNFEQISY